MPDLQFFGQSTQATSSRWGATSRLINLYSQPLGSRRILRTVIGTEDFATPTGTYCRTMAEVEGNLYVIQQATLYRIEVSGSATSLGAVGGDPDATISGNNGKVTIVSGGAYYLLDGGSLTNPPSGAFDAFGSVGFINNYTILTEENGRRVQWSGAADPKSLDGLDFATAEARDDNIIRGLAVGPEYWLFGERSIERWGVSSTGGISVIPGATIDIGLKSFRLLAEIPGGVFFIGDDNNAYVAGGGAVQPVTSIGVADSLTDNAPVSVIYYEDGSQKFCAIVFSDRPAWVYDISTQEWHERASGNTLGPWNARASAKAYGAFFIGTDIDGVKKLSRTNKDGSDVIVRRAVSETMENSGNWFIVANLLLTGRTGWAGVEPDITPETEVAGTGAADEAIDTGAGDEAIELGGAAVDDDIEKIEMRISRDRGHTWGAPKQKSVGYFGEYDRRVNWRGSLGQFRQFTAEITMSREVEFSMDSAATVDVA